MHAIGRVLLCLFIVSALSGCGGPKKEEAPPPAPVAKPEPPPPPPEPPANTKIPWSPALASTPPRGLPPVPVPPDNPVTPEKAELGRKLYFDKRLSADGTISCASCHNPTLGFSNAVAFSPGVAGKLGTRNSPTIYNSAYNSLQFWDGRARSLEEQALGPVTNPAEMGNTAEGMVKTVSGITEYAAEFTTAFGEGPITETKVAMAIASFERTILSGDAPYDRFKGGETSALSAEAQRGLAVFEGKGRCVVCHLGPSFMDNQFHNLGVGTNKQPVDAGRMDVTKDEKDWAKFKTPTLRNVALTAPYMHDGSEPSLEAVVEVYDKGGIANKNRDPLVQPLQLTPDEKKDLVTFMKEALTREVDVPLPPPVAPAAPPAENQGEPMSPHGEQPAQPAPAAPEGAPGQAPPPSTAPGAAAPPDVPEAPAPPPAPPNAPAQPFPPPSPAAPTPPGT